MLILGIESSCDDAAAALVADGRYVRGECLHSQAADFAEWGGVVPELAARSHMQALPDLIDAVMRVANVSLSAIDAVAVTAWPGLSGSLLAGVVAAKMLAARLQRPLIAVDHIQAHIAAIMLECEPPVFPLVALVASGGHSHLYRVTSPGEAELLGGTIDDAAGEAFDKAAAVLGLGYPGGPLIDALAAKGDPLAVALPRSFAHDSTLRFSFSGLKTAVLHAVRGPRGDGVLPDNPQRIADMAASFQRAVVDQLTAKVLLAARRCGVRGIAVCGGVACNRELRARLMMEADRAGFALSMPAPQHCADNAAMIAALGFHWFHAGRIADQSLLALPTGRAGPRALG